MKFMLFLSDGIAFSPMKKKQKDLSSTSPPFFLDSIRDDFPFFFLFSLNSPCFSWVSCWHFLIATNNLGHRCDYSWQFLSIMYFQVPKALHKLFLETEILANWNRSMNKLTSVHIPYSGVFIILHTEYGVLTNSS